MPEVQIAPLLVQQSPGDPSKALMGSEGPWPGRYFWGAENRTYCWLCSFTFWSLCSVAVCILLLLIILVRPWTGPLALSTLYAAESWLITAGLKVVFTGSQSDGKGALLSAHY